MPFFTFKNKNHLKPPILTNPTKPILFKNLISTEKHSRTFSTSIIITNL